MKYLQNNWKRVLLIACDVFLFAGSYFIAFLLRFDMSMPPSFFSTMMATLPLVVGIRVGTCWFFGVYKGSWRYASIEDLISLFKAVSISSALIAGSIYLSHGFIGYPRSVFIIDWLTVITLIGGLRFSIRVSKELVLRKSKAQKRVLIVGAGDAGETILRESKKNRGLKYDPIGLIDDDPKKLNMEIHGVRVIGSKESIPKIVKRKGVEEIIIAIPSATGKQMKSIVEYCRKARIRYRTVPSLTDIIDGKINVNQLREVRVEDLLNRQPIKLDLTQVKEYIIGKKVLVTGAGGSIGSELCRHIARFDPQMLILFERAENSLFYLDLELSRSFPKVPKAAVVADITDKDLTNRILETYQPDIVFHAAAHKHVPLMELNPEQAIKNNVIGTKNIAQAASRNGVDKFVFISTDKAVNPINFMGASKRIAEQYVQGLGASNSTKFLSVRFGNVAGSTGSVVRLFKEQIARGGPVTVTHPEAFRYFMTISEAVQLVLQATTLGTGGEIFVLDMGEPVRILDLAKEMIVLSGLNREDIDIVFTALRPGEKLNEELFNEGEEIEPTVYDKIMVTRTNSYDWIKLNQDMSVLEKLASEMNRDGITEKLKEMFPTFQHSSISVNVGLKNL